ncbi:MAG: hypothetical protein ACRCTY_02525, partial [Candidatus Adiutrix sp.]
SPPPGQILGLNKGLLTVQAGQNTVVTIAELQPEGKRKMTATEFFRGYIHPTTKDSPQTDSELPMFTPLESIE